MEKGGPIRAISRSISVLQAINRAGSMSMTDIAQATAMPYPTTRRIVETLLNEGLIEREPARKHYRPTALVETLSHGFQGHGRLVMMARPFIVQLTEKLGWPVSLSTHVGQKMVIRDSTHALTTLTFNNYYPGYSVPILESASGRAHIAFASELERATIIRTLKSLPENAANNTLALFDSGVMVREIQQDGFATMGRNMHTQNPGKTSSIGAPVFQGDSLIGTIALVFFSSALKMSDAVERYAPEIKRTAAAIGEALDNPSSAQFAA
ncbi:MAG: helix-turn-helix domain-containing protein [Caulobacteraceae bacterium]